jgi:hypothetical protein
LLTLLAYFYMLIGAPKLLAKGTSMKLRTLVLALGFALVSAAAYAQSGIYVTMEAQQFTQQGVNDPPHVNSADIDRPWLFGPAYGVYVDVTHIPYFGALKTGPVVFGFDARGQTLRLSEYGSQFDAQDGLFSLRVATKHMVKGVSPYIQGGFGIGHTRVPFRSNYSNNFLYQVSIGADRKLKGRVDWRVAEASAGFLGNYYTGYYPSGVGPNQSNYIVTVGTGLVFRPRR